MRLRRPRRRPRIWRVSILVLAFLFFVGPIVASLRFSFIQQNGKDGLGNYSNIFHDASLTSALLHSLAIAGLTTVIMLVLMLPTVVWVRLRLPRVALFVETVSVLPIVIPPIVMAAGLAELQLHAGQGLDNTVFASSITALTPFYVILSLPFAYRAIDVGVRAIDLHTLVDAGRSLGASWFTLIVRIILPNVRTAVLTAASLAIALVLAEVVIAGTLLYDTYPVELVNQGQQDNGIAVALSVLSLVITWLLLFGITFIGGRGSSRDRVARLV